MPSVVTTQTDFSAGEIDSAIKRDNKNPIMLAGVRQAANWRILNTKGMQNRSGRRALFKASDRVEEVLMAPGVTYYLAFTSAKLRVYDSTGALVFDDSARPWSASTAKNVVWAIYDKSIYVTFPGMVPRILTWDGVTTWAAADFSEYMNGNQKRTIFYRLSPKNITMQPSALTGAGITLAFSAGMNLVAGHVGTRMRFIDSQLLITAVASAVSATATVEEPLFGTNTFLIGTAGIRGKFSIGDVVVGQRSNATGIICGITVIGPDTQFIVQITKPNGDFLGTPSSEAMIGPNGYGVIGTGITPGVPGAVTDWDDEVMNSFRGFPASVFSDQGRLGLCNFPALPNGIGWSAFGVVNDFYVGANPTDAIFELAPNKSQVYYVVPGMDASEFVFCDKGLYYIQITPANPLKPGSVGFNTISEDECGAVQPRRAGEFILYADGGLNQINALRIFGAYSRSYKTESVTDLSAHLFTSITAIAIMTASGSFAERYAFVLNADGSVVTGKYALNQNNQLEGVIGWTPWTGNGTAKWVAAKGANVLFTTSYAPNGIGAVQIVEQLDDSRYLDGSMLYNTQPSGLPIPGGKGPLWWIPGGAVDLMDGPLGTRMMGTYTIDANGFLIPQNNAGEDFTSVNLVVGQAWTATLEPFVPPVQPGQDVGQRMWKRRIARAQVYVANSSGFVMERLYSDQSGANLPAAGTVMKQRRISTWNQDEDPTQPPPLREQSYLDRPIGRSHDPRWAVLKDTPGPITVLETSFEVSV